MKFFSYILCMAAIISLPSCNLDDNDKQQEVYDNWRELNEAFMNDMAGKLGSDGQKLYTKVVPAWNTNAYVLMRWFNDTAETRGNLRPLYTSTIDCKYHGRLYDDVPFDSSYLNVSPADSIFRTKLSNVISGWTIAFERMHVGDSVEVIIPYTQGYGSQWSGSIPPYSSLIFNIKFTDVVAEYIRPVE